MPFSEWAGFARSSELIYRRVLWHSDFPGRVRFRQDPRFLVRYAWMEESSRHIICFRGSVTRENERLTRRSWELNFRTEQRRINYGPNSRVHAGYLHQAGLVYRQLRGRILDGKLVFLIGHSQGGALALAMALQIVRFAPGTPVGVITFGQPRIGNRGLARQIDLHAPMDVVRVVNSGDVVSRLPIGLLGYDHCERPVYLLGGGRFSEDHVRISPSWGSIRAHGVALYRERLEILGAANP